MRRRLTDAGLALLLGLLPLLALGQPAAAQADTVSAYALAQPFALDGHRLSGPGNAFFNGLNFAPVTVLYGGQTYVAIRFVAAMFDLGIGWLPAQRMVTLQQGNAVSLPDISSWYHPTFSGRYALQPRYLQLQVRGVDQTPPGRIVRLNGQLLPDALYAQNTTYMPLEMVAQALGVGVQWPDGQSVSPQQTAFDAQIRASLTAISPGSVVHVGSQTLGRVPQHAVSDHWTLVGPDGAPLPLLSGDSGPSQQLLVPADAQPGAYTLWLRMQDTQTGAATQVSRVLFVRGGPPAYLSVPSIGFTPQAIAKAYDITRPWLGGDLGQGNTIVLYEQQGFSNSDLAAFDSAFGLPSPQIRVQSPGGPLDPGLEATMDIEWAHALAPLAKLRVIEDAGADTARTFPDFLASTLSQAMATTSASIASISYGVQLSAAQQQADNGDLSSLLAQGLSIFASTGDTSATNGGALLWPALAPSVVGVGGTTLQSTQGHYRQTLWGSSTYGLAKIRAPHRQSAVTGILLRSVPDVAFDGDPRTGVDVYFDGGWWLGGGTSVGAPAWAAIWALCQTAVPTVPSAPYALYNVANTQLRSPALHTPVGVAYQQGVGLGVPDVHALIAVLNALYGF